MKMILDAKQQFFPECAQLADQLDHDVRSPLTAICTYAECLGQVEASDLDRRERYVGAIVGAARRVGRMCADFAVLAAPQPDERLREVDIEEALRGALGELDDFMEILDVTVQVLPLASPILLFWPRAVLRHLLTGTLESVLGSVAQGATVVVEAKAESRDATLCLTPQGSRPFLYNPDHFSFRAAACLVGARGGSLMVREGDAPQVRLNLPFAGRLCEAPVVPGLERSA